MTQEFVTLPRAVVEHVMHHLNRGDDDAVCWADGVIKPALEQSQRKLTAQDIADSALLGNIESPFNACMHQEHCKRWKAQAGLQHQHESRHINDLATKTSHSVTTCSTVPEGWKMVPVEPTIAMLCDAVMEWEGQAVYKVMSASGLRKLEEQAADGYRSMLAAEPQPPTVKECLTVEQPQVDQEPVAWMYAVDGEDEPRLHFYEPLAANNVSRITPLYTHPQPPRQPLTDTKVVTMLAELTCRDPARANDYDWGYELQIIRAIEASHNIK